MQLTKLLLILFAFVFASQSCNEYVPIPAVPVDFTLDLNDPEYNELVGVGNVITVFAGSRGVMVKRIGFTEFVAFDQHCPYDPDEPDARVSPQEGSVDFAQCKSCATLYNLYFGNVEEGPGSYPLQSYHAVYYPNSNKLRVYR